MKSDKIRYFHCSRKGAYLWTKILKKSISATDKDAQYDEKGKESIGA